MNENDVPLRPFSVAPIQSDDALGRYQRLPKELALLAQEIINSPGGSLLVTGYRGVGKTSFVNKTLYEVHKHLQDQGKFLVTVHLSLARGYSTDKLLRRLIRELYHAINHLGVYQFLDAGIKYKLDISFLRTSRQIKTALSEGLKEAISYSETESKTTSRSYSLAPTIGFDKLSASLASLSRQDTRTNTHETMTSQEISRERGLELEFLEYDDEIAENDLSELIDLLADRPAEFGQKIASPSRKIKSPHFFWSRIPQDFKVGKFTIKNYIESSTETWTSNPKGMKLVFVLDEIDKMTIEQAQDIFRSLKNLFLKGNITFIVISGKEFYYEWLLKKIAEDDLLFSLFTRVIHIPLFNDDEFNNLAEQLCQIAGGFPKSLFVHLAYKAKGTPREFFRELFRHVQWIDGQPVVKTSLLDDRILNISNRLFPYIQKIYSDIATDDKIDLGIKDHIRRSLHNWLEWMTMQVIFYKEDVFRLSQGEEKQRHNEILFVSRTRSTFENLFKALIDDKIIHEYGQSDTGIVYAFDPQIREQLEAIDSSVSDRVRSEMATKQKELTEQLVQANRLYDSGDYEKALSTISFALQIDSANSEALVYKERIENTIRNQELIALANKYLSDGDYRRAYNTYLELVKARNVSTPEIEEKLNQSRLQLVLAEVDTVLISGDYRSVMANLKEAINQSSKTASKEVFELQQQATELLSKLDLLERSSSILEDSMEKMRLNEITNLLDEIKRFAPESRRTLEILKRVSRIQEDYLILEQTKDALKKGDFNRVENDLRQVTQSLNKELAIEAMSLRKNIDRVQTLLSNAEQSITLGNMGEAQNIIDEIELIGSGFVTNIPQLQRLKFELGRHKSFMKLQKEFDDAVKARDLESAWELLDELKVESSDRNSSQLYKRSVRHLTDLTLETVQKDLGNAKQEKIIISSRRYAKILTALIKHDPENTEAKMLFEKYKL